MPARKQIFLKGESPLVREFTTLFEAHGYIAAMSLPPGLKSVTTPKGVKKSTRPHNTLECTLELTNIDIDAKKRNLIELDRKLPVEVPILSSSITITCTEQATWVKNPDRLLGLAAFPTLTNGSLIEFAPSPVTSKRTTERAERIAASVGKEPAFVRDSVGMVMPRILSMLVNEAAFAMMEGTAAGDDIDTAMKLGTNHPRGPVEWGKAIGLKQVVAVLATLHEYFGEERYRICPLLKDEIVRETLFLRKQGTG